MRLGQITRRWSGIAGDGIFEHKERIAAFAECPVCHQEVPLLGETDGWVECGFLLSRNFPPRQYWKHDSYGPSAAEHCGKLLADWWEGSFVFDLQERI